MASTETSSFAACLLCYAVFCCVSVCTQPSLQSCFCKKFTALLCACNLPGVFSKLQAAWLQIHQTTNSANPLLRLAVLGYHTGSDGQGRADYIWYAIRRDGTNVEPLIPVIARPDTGADFEKLHPHAILYDYE